MSNYLDNLELFDSKVIARGRAIYKEKSTQISSICPTDVKAVIYSGGHFNVRLQFDPDHDMVSATCDCGAGFCEHMVACLYEASDQLSNNSVSENEEDGKEKEAAFLSAVEDVKNSVFRFNYKGLSKSMEIFSSILLKNNDDGKVFGLKALFESFLSKGKYAIDYDRLIPYIREVIKRSGLDEGKLISVFYDLLGQHMSSEAFWVIMNKDAESSVRFQSAALIRLQEGMTPPYYLSTCCPPTTWATVNPLLLDELLDAESFVLTKEDMAELIKKASSRKDNDATVDLFATAIKNFDGFLLDPSILTSLIESPEHRARIESIFYEEFSSSPSPEKYLLWRSVATDGDFEERFLSSLDSLDDATRSFILLREGRDKVGDAYNGLDVRAIPFRIIPYALDNVNEEFAKQEILDYCEEEESDILHNVERRTEDIRILLKAYGMFGKEHLERLLANPLVVELAKEEKSLRGRILSVAYENGLLPILGVKVYQG